jgi:hypothetical protein
MSKYAKLFEYFRQCPELADLWSIAAVEENKVRVILPQGASPVVQYQEKMDTLGNYECNIVPYPSIYEDFQINCYQKYDPNDSTEPFDNYNVLQLETVERICKWVKEQNDIGNFPQIDEKIISVECNPFVPQIRYVNDDEKIICYFITVRLRYVNRAQRKTVEYECED